MNDITSRIEDQLRMNSGHRPEPPYPTEEDREPFIAHQIESKVLEIRDEGTFIGVLAIRMLGANPIQAYYLRRCGYPADGSSIMLMLLADGRATNDPYEWPARGLGQRTMGNAHNWIIDHFNELSDGDVVDVQVIIGETKESKVSERLVRV